MNPMALTSVSVSEQANAERLEAALLRLGERAKGDPDLALSAPLPAVIEALQEFLEKNQKMQEDAAKAATAPPGAGGEGAEGEGKPAAPKAPPPFAKAA